jgi:MFS family permease
MWNKQEKSILWITSANHFLVHVFELSFPALVIPIASYFNISLAQSFALSQGMYLLYGICALPFGFLCDRWNIRLLLALGCIGAGIASFAAAIAPSPFVLMLALSFVGVFTSVYHPVGLSLISHSVSQRGKAMGINGVFGNIGISLAPLMAGVCNYLWGWRSVFWILGVLGMLMGARALAMKEIPKIKTEEIPVEPKEQKQLMYYFFILCIVITFAGFLYRAITVSLPAYMEQNGPAIASGITTAKNNPLRNLTANLFVFIIYLGGIVGQIIAGHWADKHDLRKLYFLFYLAIVPVVLFVAFAKGYFLVFISMILIFFELGMQPVENSLVAKFTPVKWRSTAYGFKFILGLGVGSVSVAIVAFIQKNYGFSAVFKAGALNAFIVVCIIAFLWYVSRKIRVYNQEPKIPV